MNKTGKVWGGDERLAACEEFLLTKQKEALKHQDKSRRVY
jgi:hypothetical protein